MDTIKITYGSDTITLTCDLAQASSPLRIDGHPTQWQTADARHRTANAVLLAAMTAWPEEQWPSRPRTGSAPIEATEAWDALSYETVEDETVEDEA